MRRRRTGRPGLIGTAARTAVIAGTATAVSGAVGQAVHRNAAQQAVAPQPSTVPPTEPVLPPTTSPEQSPSSTPPMTPDAQIAQLQQLADLKQAGVLSDEEFESLKAKVLAG